MIPSEYFCLLLFCCMSKLTGVIPQQMFFAANLAGLALDLASVLRAQTVTSKQHFTYNEFKAKSSGSELHLAKLEFGPCRIY